MTLGIEPEQRNIPTIQQAVVFRLKSFLLQLDRLIRDRFGRRHKKFRRFDDPSSLPVIALSISKLWSETNVAERHLVAGKINNLRRAVACIDGVEIPADKVFSFWRHIGRTSRYRGFVEGRELREGCLIPSVGGGLCQLSNALYDAALQANIEIVERHAHTRVVDGSLAESGRDATVFWNYVDLRFRPSSPLRIEARLDSENLIVQFRGSAGENVGEASNTGARLSVDTINNCFSCGVEECRRSEVSTPKVLVGRTAYLVDEFWPEFDEHISQDQKRNDLFIPLDGRRFRRPNYAWSTDGFDRTEQFRLFTATRSYSSRRLSAQGAARQLNLLSTSQRLARIYGRRLKFDHVHVVVQQNLLPFLWRDGHLGRRSFDVLMTSLPMYAIQERLDQAHLLHPESKTLADFRADERLVTAEREALENARRVITPHTSIAEMFGSRAKLIEWKLPIAERRLIEKTEKPIVVFPSTTVGRKGCYELRQALRGLDVKIILLGPVIESPDFWKGFDSMTGGAGWLDQATVVVLPAFVEHRPRRLLLAVAAGIPVIATPHCGVSEMSGILEVQAGQVDDLRCKLHAVLGSTT